MAEIHIPPLPPEPLFQIGSLTITNTIVNTWIGICLLFVLGLAISRKVRLRPGAFQNGCEYILELILPYFDQVTGDRKKTIRFLPIVGSLFFFLLLSNWLGLLPGTGSITFGSTPLLRPASTDLNLNLAMALVAVLGSHLYGFISVGIFSHIGKFIQIKGLFTSITKGPMAFMTAVIHLFVGFLEIIGEMAKVVSLSLRLFGNIFAGEVLLSVMSALVGILVPTPFMFLEIIVGIVQASVFSMLTLVYLTVATAEPEEAH